MNIVLFEKNERGLPLPAKDPRALHILNILGLGLHDTFDAGFINGGKGKARIDDIDGNHLHFTFLFDPDDRPEALYPVILLTGFSRPQTCRKILREATSLGVSGIYFAATEKEEETYRMSRLWTTGEYRRHLVCGAEQAASTAIPRISFFDSIDKALDETGSGNGYACDNYESTVPLSGISPGPGSVCCAVGTERGWSAGERDAFRRHGYSLVSLGERVLRTETACVVSVSLILSVLNYL